MITEISVERKEGRAGRREERRKEGRKERRKERRGSKGRREGGKGKGSKASDQNGSTYFLSMFIFIFSD